MIYFGVILSCLLLLVACSAEEAPITQPDLVQEPVAALPAAEQAVEPVPEPVPIPEPVALPVPSPVAEAPPVDEMMAVKEFTVTAKQWSFEPATITVKKGDKVKMKITSVDVAHGIRLAEFAVSERLSPGKTVNVEFVADKVGSFSFFCSVSCGSGHRSMKGTLVVE
jgi:heme/copper-type cytochrome/quinol oxidase subunit 2